MKINIFLPYEETEKYYEKWAQAEKEIDFENEPFEAERCTVSYAAEELFRYLKKLGFEASVTNKKADKNIILKSLGKSGEEFSIKTDGDDIILEGDGRIGVLYAAYELLEAQGIKWYSPKEEYVPVIDELVIPECKHYKYDMSWGRGFHFEGLMKESVKFIKWMARNRMNLHACHSHSKKLQQKLGFLFKTGGHIFETILNPLNIDENGGYYIDVHRDWYGKRSGEITAENARSVQFCVTNEELLDKLAQTVIHKMKTDWKNEDIYELAGFDTWGASCECENCKKLGNGTDRTLHFLSHIRKRIDEAKLPKKVKLSFDAYQGTDTLEPPQNPVPQNLIDAGDYALYCPILRCYSHDLYDTTCDKNAIYQRTLEGWLKTGMKVAMNEYYNVSKFEDLPILFTKRMANDIKYYIEKGVVEIEYMHTPMVEWGVRTLNQYLLANLARNKDSDCEKIIKNYFCDFYGKYADKAEEAYQLIEKATELSSSWRCWFDTSILTHLSEWDGKTPTEPFYRESHLKDDAVKYGYETVEMLKNALEILRNIKKSELSVLDPAMFSGNDKALNPVEQAKKRVGSRLLNKVNEDIRGLIYGVDVFEIMVLFLEYYNALYEKKEADAILDRIIELGDKMSEYTFGIIYNGYGADSGVSDALFRSQLKNLYYKCIANRKRR